MAKYPSKAQMINALVDAVDDWDLETMIAVLKDVRRAAEPS